MQALGTGFSGMALYPLFAELEGREVLVVGGGDVAARKVAALLRAGALVRLHAREVLHRLLGEVADWTAMEHFLLRYLTDPSERKTAIASAFAASLEMVREGHLEIRQEGVFEPIYLRRGARAPVNDGKDGDRV